MSDTSADKNEAVLRVLKDVEMRGIVGTNTMSEHVRITVAERDWLVTTLRNVFSVPKPTEEQSALPVILKKHLPLPLPLPTIT